MIVSSLTSIEVVEIEVEEEASHFTSIGVVKIQMEEEVSSFGSIGVVEIREAEANPTWAAIRQYDQAGEIRPPYL